MTERNWRLRRLQLYITLEVKERLMGATQAAWLAVCTEQPRCLKRKENEVGRWGGRMRRRVDHPAVSYTKRLRNRLVSATSEQKKLKNIKKKDGVACASACKRRCGLLLEGVLCTRVWHEEC